jgi:hypothetical protein
MSSAQKVADVPIKKRTDRSGSGVARFVDFSIKNTIEKDRQLKCNIQIINSSRTTYQDFKLSLDIIDDTTKHVANITNFLNGTKLTLKPGKNEFNLVISDINLVPGRYSINLFMASDQYNSEIFDWIEGATTFGLADYDYYNTGVPPTLKGKEVFLDFRYEQR